MEKKGIAPADWDKLMALLKDALTPEQFKLVQGILEGMCTFYV